MPVRQPSVMASDKVSQDTSMHAELRYGMLCAGGGVIDTANRTFKMRFRIVTGYGLDTPLEFRTVFPKVMPQPRHLRPIPAAEIARAFLCALRHTAQVFVQIVRNKHLAVLTNMRQVADGFVLLGSFRHRSAAIVRR